MTRESLISTWIWQFCYICSSTFTLGCKTGGEYILHDIVWTNDVHGTHLFYFVFCRFVCLASWRVAVYNEKTIVYSPSISSGQRESKAGVPVHGHPDAYYSDSLFGYNLASHHRNSTVTNQRYIVAFRGRIVSMIALSRGTLIQNSSRDKISVSKKNKRKREWERENTFQILQKIVHVKVKINSTERETGEDGKFSEVEFWMIVKHVVVQYSKNINVKSANNRFCLSNQLPRSTVQCDPIFSLRCQYNPQLHSSLHLPAALARTRERS